VVHKRRRLDDADGDRAAVEERTLAGELVLEERECVEVEASAAVERHVGELHERAKVRRRRIRAAVGVRRTLCRREERKRRAAGSSERRLGHLKHLLVEQRRGRLRVRVEGISGGLAAGEVVARGAVALLESHGECRALLVPADRAARHVSEARVAAALGLLASDSDARDEAAAAEDDRLLVVDRSRRKAWRLKAGVVAAAAEGARATDHVRERRAHFVPLSALVDGQSADGTHRTDSLTASAVATERSAMR